MAFNVKSAVQTLASPAFLKSAALIVAGSLAADVVTGVARDQIVDIDLRGGDAVYALVAAALTLVIVPGRFGRPAALGMVSGAGAVAAQEFGLF